MGKRILTVIAMLACVYGGPLFATPDVALNSEDDKVLYALGVKLMLDLAPFQLDKRELALVYAGMQASFSGQYLIDPGQYQQGVDNLAHRRVAKRAEAAKERGTRYVEQAKALPGAKSSASGMVWFLKQPGAGAQPSPKSTVRVHYKGTLVDGTEFDSSYSRGKPAEFPLDRVIPCWTDGISQLRVGAKARLICPSEIAYGSRGAAPIIPPGATLIFDVELLGIVTP